MLPSNVLHTYLQSENDPLSETCLRLKSARKIKGDRVTDWGFSSTARMKGEPLGEGAQEGTGQSTAYDF